MEQVKEKVLPMVGAIILFIGVVGYYFYDKMDNGKEIVQEEENKNLAIVASSKELEKEEIIVHIAGEINKPGIVKQKDGARIMDIIEAAGGLTEKADLSDINLAEVAEDGQKIVIPNQAAVKEESLNMSSPVTTTTKETKININKATTQELQQIEGIGPSLANKIIEYRNQNGNFRQIEDLKQVPGIGEAKFGSMQEKITIK